MNADNSILFLGDSLTAGNLGSSYLKCLEEDKNLKAYRLINAGENGYTMAGLDLKLESYLKMEETPEILVLEGGANDLLLPHMQRNGTDWDPFIRKLSRHGSIPAKSIQEFREYCASILSRALDAGINHVFVCTIPFLGENLKSSLNQERELYNQILRELCSEYSNPFFDCTCIDASKEAEPLLSGSSSRWLFTTPDELQKDAQSVLEKGEDSLCRSRNLLLTIDGAHLNSKGAAFFSALILKVFRDNSIIP